MILDEELKGIVRRLSRRPGHETVRADLRDLLIRELGMDGDRIRQEAQTVEIRGRIDTLLGRTVIELKSDLRKELQDVEARLPDYLRDSEKRSSQSFVGVATDGHTFIAYHLDRDQMREIGRAVSDPEHPRLVVDWLRNVVSVGDELDPTPDNVRDILGRTSPAWGVARDGLASIWERLSRNTEVRLKRDLWAGLIERVYGSPLGDDELFFQHTYLTAVAKTIACQALGLGVPEDAADLLSGKAFDDAGVHGVVESDFFDWPLADPAGAALIKSIALHTARFRLKRVQADVLKGLYESLVDPQQRHELGEYYTPDWLAQRIVESVVSDPLSKRVLDPSCGSGTFVFHAVRRVRDAARAERWPLRRVINYCVSNVLGIDIHPVAVQIARVTYLLALGDLLQAKGRPEFSVPIYLGDSLQWKSGQRPIDRDVPVDVPGGRTLLFPHEVSRDPRLFDELLNEMLDQSQVGAPPEAFVKAMERRAEVSPQAALTLGETYRVLRALVAEGRDHIWGFVARNLVKPAWLSQPEQRVDVLLGNPPWLTQNRMSQSQQDEFKKWSEELGTWVGGRGVTPHQDLSGYFFARAAALYSKPGGIVAFVIPRSALYTRPYAYLRTGNFGLRSGGRIVRPLLSLRFTEAWDLDQVAPLFEVPACVLFARTIDNEGAPLPSTVKVARGLLPRRDASPAEATKALAWTDADWPDEKGKNDLLSSYGDQFRQGAIVIPRVLFRVKQVEVGPLGTRQDRPLIGSARSAQEKTPWKESPSLRGNVEQQFVMQLLLGESLAPYRVLETEYAVIPWSIERQALVDSDVARTDGYTGLAGWLADAELAWKKFGRGKRGLLEQLDYYGQLTAQFPAPPLRVVFAASGKLPAAALVRDAAALAEHALYWAPVASVAEGAYLTAVFNSETARARVERLQAKGQWGARHFDKLMLSLPIPRFDRTVGIHASLSGAGAKAEKVAAAVPLADGVNFIRARKYVRSALETDGVAGEIDRLVAELLGPA